MYVGRVVGACFSSICLGRAVSKLQSRKGSCDKFHQGFKKYLMKFSTTIPMLITEIGLTGKSFCNKKKKDGSSLVVPSPPPPPFEI